MKKLLLMLKGIMLILTLCLFSCSQTLQPVSSGVLEPLSANEGYLLFGINSDNYIKKINFSNLERSLSYAPNNAEQEEAYFLAKVPVGSYYFSSIDTGLGEYDVFDGYKWQFNVVANTVNYVGHIEIDEFMRSRDCNCRKIILANKSSVALDYLTAHYPDVLETLAISYQGPESDSFIEYIAPALKAHLKLTNAKAQQKGNVNKVAHDEP